MKAGTQPEVWSCGCGKRGSDSISLEISPLRVNFNISCIYRDQKLSEKPAISRSCRYKNGVLISLLTPCGTAVKTKVW
jgi:hypothetical protein